jgi:hypothetical protein
MKKQQIPAKSGGIAEEEIPSCHVLQFMAEDVGEFSFILFQAERW